MQNSKEFFLSALGIYSFENVVKDSIIIKREHDSEPFAELTTKDGKTVLTVGKVHDNWKL